MSEAAGGDRALEGRAALVTGASSGLGMATAVALARAGADVALVARSAKELEETGKEVSKTGRRALTLPTDLAREDEAAAAVGQTVEEFGRVDVLVNAAGIDVPGTVEELDVGGWDLTLSVNLRAPFLLSKAAFPHMREAGGGTIVNVSSVAGKKGWANASAYCASKFGLTGFTEALADEGREHGIRAIVLYPGAMATNWGAFSPDERRQREPNGAPATRALPPEQVADFIAWFVASPPGFVLTEGIVLPIEEGLP
ncbi:MAG: SDR family oxidoreductase [Actinomycetota bacterium]|nr:SDR family oxidoreductase [Actinomycetota bacterium]